MRRPDDRPLRRLPTLEPRKATLERCVFCPKLCRSTCPVSNADPRETLTPWGKMSMAYFAANESVPLEHSYASTAWACTGCFGCREACDHRNDVTGTLYDARSAWVTAGVAPEGALREIREFAQTESSLRTASNAFATMPEVDPTSPSTVLLGCAYARHAPATARDAIRAAAKLAGGPVSLATTCCGAPLLQAGAGPAFAEQAARFAESVEKTRDLIVLDADCAATIRVHYAHTSVTVAPKVEHFIELAGRKSELLQQVDLVGSEPVRYHDPCQLGRGLGVYEAPRQVLARAFGRAPGEFARNREGARCSGGGGLLPKTMPETADAIAQNRIDEHDELGGGVVVTACASSFQRFTEQGAKTLDLVTVVARALGIDPE